MNSGFHNIPRLKTKEWGDWLGVDSKLYGKIIAFCIKEWFDEMEDIWKKNWRRLQYIFDPEFMSERKNTWDEIVKQYNEHFVLAEKKLQTIKESELDQHNFYKS